MAPLSCGGVILPGKEPDSKSKSYRTLAALRSDPSAFGTNDRENHATATETHSVRRGTCGAPSRGFPHPEPVL